VRLTVDDSGPGIPPQERDRVFDRFHRATDAPGGAGLGLAIADAIVHATGGRWAIGVSPAGGASVSASWPRSVSGRREPHQA
jgi:signal transduction histidine kinase